MLRRLRPYRTVPDLLAPEALARLRSFILDSPYLASSELSYRFDSTLGFSVFFRREGIVDVCRELPPFEPYLENVLDPRCNAFYINPLVIYKGAGVGAHADRTLLSLTSPLLPPYPLKTSVLYVDMPAQLTGGDLIFYFVVPFARVTPRTNTLVEFLGSLRHAVTKVGQSGEGPPQARISLVCEQYGLKDHLLEQIPRFLLRTDRRFEDFLEAAEKGSG